MTDINRAYLVVPKLIAQPTWGGTYIIVFKGWQNLPFAQTAIGQSYELYSKSLLSKASSSEDPSFQPEFDSYPENSFPISQLIGQDKEKVLGTNSISKSQGELKTLIKFTQAKGNSFQIHVKAKTKSDKWLPKPESWYYFENGIATLGIKDLSKLDNYKNAVIKIDSGIKLISDKFKNKKISLEEAKMLINKLISDNNIYDFINLVRVPANSIVDLSQGGVHHSWEEDESLPKGNIVYEVQADVMDHMSTIRSFDKGKMNDDGNVRPLQINDYFRYLDTSAQNNNPQTLLKKRKALFQDNNLQVSEVFATEYYNLNELELKSKATNQYTDTQGKSFHHLFVKDGELEYQDVKVTLTVSPGHSIFIPAGVGRYSLKNQTSQTTVLQTFI